MLAGKKTFLQIHNTPCTILPLPFFFIFQIHPSPPPLPPLSGGGNLNLLPPFKKGWGVQTNYVTPLKTQKNFLEKMKNIAIDIITLHKCTKNHDCMLQCF